MTAPYWLDPVLSEMPFPSAQLALRDPNGLLAIGGDLEPERLLNAYRNGIFPWFSEGQPILWWSPEPRSVLFPEQLRVSRSLRKSMRQERFRFSFDRAFDQVIESCAAAPRPGQNGTWIVDDMVSAYMRLHRLGHAHSVEAWESGELVGGLYGIAIGKVFFGESMFARATDASKTAFVSLVNNLRHWDFALIDCQVETAHLNSLGAQNIARAEFLKLLQHWCQQPPAAAAWREGASADDFAGPAR